MEKSNSVTTLNPSGMVIEEQRTSVYGKHVKYYNARSSLRTFGKALESSWLERYTDTDKILESVKAERDTYIRSLD